MSNKLRLYCVRFDGGADYVLADGYQDAVDRFQHAVTGSDLDWAEDEDPPEPDSVELIAEPDNVLTFGSLQWFSDYVNAQIEWSRETFGPGQRTKGVLAHIRKELEEIEKNPTDLEEWCDVIILALDGAWRSGGNTLSIAAHLSRKALKNRQREWPDWRTKSEDEAIEHKRSTNETPVTTSWHLIRDEPPPKGETVLYYSSAGGYTFGDDSFPCVLATHWHRLNPPSL